MNNHPTVFVPTVKIADIQAFYAQVISFFQSPTNFPLVLLSSVFLGACAIYVFYWLTLYFLNKRSAYYSKQIILPVINPEDEQQQIAQMRSTFATLQGYILSNRSKLSIEMYKINSGIVFQIGSNSKSVLERVETTLKQIRNITITDMQEDTLSTMTPFYCKTVSNIKDFYQITQDENFFDNVLNMLNSLPDDTCAGVQFILRGVNKNEEMQRRRRNLENRAVKAKRRQTDRETYLFNMYQKKQEGNLFKVKINIIANKKQYLSHLVSLIKTLNFEENTFYSRGETTKNVCIRFISPDTYFSNVHFRRKHEGSYFTNTELAYLFHPTSLQLGGLSTKQTNTIEARPEFLEQTTGNILIGTTQTQRGTTENLYYPIESFQRHGYAIGKTGSGKSSLLVTMLNPLMHKEDTTVFVLDPHGDLLTDVLSSLAKEEKEVVKRIVYLNINNTDRTFTINPLFAFRMSAIQKAVIRDKLLDIIKNETEEVAGGATTGVATFNRIKQMLEICLEFADAYYSYLVKRGMEKKQAEQLVHERQLTLNDLPYLLEKKFDYITPLKEIFKNNTTESGIYIEKLMSDHMQQQSVVEAVQARLSQLLHPSLKLIYEGNSLHIKEIMTCGKTFLFPIPQRIFGTNGSRGLLQIIFSLLWMNKQEVEDKNKRKDTYVFIDEFQNAQTEDVPTILSEARKYKLRLFVSNQYLGQLKEKIKNAIFGNVGTIISFTVGAGENGAAVLASNFDDMVTEKDLTLLPSHHAFMKTKIPNTNESLTFSFSTIPVNGEEDTEFINKLNKASLKQYGELKSVIEEKLAKKRNSPLEFFFDGIK